jgi:Uma2 family endonuclease
MSTPTLISLAEYLSTSYRPDCDYVDGEIRERNVGESERSILQAAITAWFWNHQREWEIEVRPEQRVQVSPTRYRVPDVCVLRGDQPREPIASTPPLICIEILSKADTLRSMRERVKDYLDFGTEHVWVLDPATREAFVCSQSGLDTRTTGHLLASGTPVFLSLEEVFSALD